MRIYSSFFIFFILLSSIFPLSSLAASESGILIVKLANENSLELLQAYDARPEHLFDSVYRINTSDKDRALAELKADSRVVYVEEDVELRAARVARDPLFTLDTQQLDKQWYLAKIQADKAWETSVGSSNITVAVVDTGIDGRHEDLNDGRVVGGYVNYCEVKDSTSASECLVRINGDLLPGVNSDDNGHGTIVAGIIGAVSNNNRGISGVAWNLQLMPIKVLDSAGSGFASDVAVGIRWAADNGADIINLSVGGSGFGGVDVLEEAIQYAFDKNVLVVAAAGNDAAVTGGNLDQNEVFPVCADGRENTVLGVTAVDVDDRKAGFANYGATCIDIAAPGTGTFIDQTVKQGILSTYFDPRRPAEHNLYVFALGTSMAAPIVSGAAVLMLDTFPELDVRAIRDRLLKSVDPIDNLNQNQCEGKSCAGLIGSGRLNLFRAVNSTDAFSGGTLVQDTQGNAFLIERGVKRPISSFVLGQRFKDVVLTLASIQDIGAFPTGKAVPPVDGTLVKQPNNATVYIVEEGALRPLSLLAFFSRRLNFNQVNELSSVEISTYEVGELAEIVDGLLVKENNNPAVFVVEGAVRRLISLFVFQQRGFYFELVADLTPAELAQFPPASDNFLISPNNGTLIRGDVSPTVYIIEGGERVGLSLKEFNLRGLSFADVKVLPQGEVDRYRLKN